MAGEKILIIEDEVKIARFLELELKYEGYMVEQENDGRSGLERATGGKFDLIILDVMLPSLNGMEVLRRLRQVSETPVIMLTAKDEVTDKVMGLDIGADDYMTKPFAIEELLARIRAVLKRRKPANHKRDIITAGDLKVNLEQHSVCFNKEPVDLTKKEYDLLCYLVQNKNMVLTRDKILETVWGYDYYGDTNVVDVYIRYLRSKIDDRFNTKLIHTVRGVGYIIKDE
ncbi:two component transcriptional regulator, winged helix family [Thermincola ferriacetica]|uniref:Stage 0 sporulation protein A homolog n=1 Tax=Thermincola ferriacetica TaxID=281456 RepID=A0A0L6W3F0_9FIRM|nr:response regulator transcription factor [Thermincola ferriacetica]KNZ69981.1 two component transcriptional regulator, winged helix family [Thermincola ferriacetica]